MNLAPTPFSKMPHAFFFEADVKEESSVKKMIEQAMDHFGRIDALVNNAGIAQMSYTPLEKTTLNAFKQIIDTNLTGAFLCAQNMQHLICANKRIDCQHRLDPRFPIRTAHRSL